MWTSAADPSTVLSCQRPIAAGSPSVSIIVRIVATVSLPLELHLAPTWTQQISWPT